MRNIVTAVVLLLSPSMLAGQSTAQHALPDDGEFTLALTGDSIITRRLSVYNEPEFLELMEMIRSADAAFTNLEILFHDYEPYPMATSGGTWMRADPSLVNDLKWAGFDLLARANNHTGDYGVEGQRLTTMYVREAGLIQAGVGESLAEAREAKFLETPRVRVALVSIASTFRNHMRAGRSRDNVPARPGLNPLGYDKTVVLPKAELDSLRSIAEKLDLFRDQDGFPRGYSLDNPDEFRVFGERFVLGDEARVETTVNDDDVTEIAAVVNNAKRLADIVIVTIHAHEWKDNRETPADFIPDFARKMVDAGADVFVGHGPHVLRGIEIYKEKPIFYSLGDFIFQNETLQRLPSENYERYGLEDHHHVADFNARRYDNDTKGFPANPEIWEAITAFPRWKDGKLVEVKLVPISLGHGLPTTVRGRPVLAEKELAEKIIRDLQVRSAPFGTRITLRNGVGYVDIE